MFLTVPVPMPETEAEHAAVSTRCCLERLKGDGLFREEDRARARARTYERTLGNRTTVR